MNADAVVRRCFIGVVYPRGLGLVMVASTTTGRVLKRQQFPIVVGTGRGGGFRCRRSLDGEPSCVSVFT